jgi:hypothetical protein
MFVYEQYHVLGKIGDKDSFLTEDKTYTKQLEYCLKFKTPEAAQAQINTFKEDETDDEYTGDHSVHHEIEVRTVKTTVE